MTEQQTITTLVNAWKEGADCITLAKTEFGLTRKATMQLLNANLTNSDRLSRWQKIGNDTLKQFTDDDLLDAIRSSHTTKDETGPTRATYKAFTEASPARLPSLATVELRFGTWSQALINAGYHRKPQTRKGQIWTREKMNEALAAAAQAHDGRLPSISVYEAYRMSHIGFPSAILIRRRYGSWAKARQSV